MSDSTNQQPLSRRERRLLEEQARHAVSQANTGAPAVGVTAYTLPAAAPVAVDPAPAPPPAPPSIPLTRRERRALESQGVAPIEATAGETSPAAAVPGGAGLTELLPRAQDALVTERQTISPEPLPPVFGIPNPTQASDFNATRTVGSVSSATSSLILSHTPMIDMTSPLSDTGEVVVTGQIRLPSSLAERGGAPALVEDREQDEVMDAYVTGAIAPTAKPMRASQAVSGKGDDTDIVLVRRARWGTASVVTGLIAGVLGLAALGLLVLALLTDVVG